MNEKEMLKLLKKIIASGSWYYSALEFDTNNGFDGDSLSADIFEAINKLENAKDATNISILEAFDKLMNSTESIDIVPRRDEYGRPDYIISGEFTLSNLATAMAGDKDIAEIKKDDPEPFTITKEQYDKDIAQAKKCESLALVNAIHSMIDARMPKYDTTTEYFPDGRTSTHRKVSDFDYHGLRDDINSLIKDYITPKS